MTNTHTPLGDLDANSQIASPIDTIPDDKTKPAPSFQAESQQHRNLHNKLLRQEQTGKQGGAYTSPSDELMSPASSKLNAMKEKRFNKTNKPRNPFGKSNLSSSTPFGVSTGKMEQAQAKEDNQRMSEG